MRRFIAALPKASVVGHHAGICGRSPYEAAIVVSGLMPPDVVARARAEFDTLAVEGSKDMTLEEALQALARHVPMGCC